MSYGTPVPKYAIGPVLRELGLVTHLRGSGRSKVRCPFHADTTPSATVDEDNQWFHCFTCGIHADAIDLLREYGNQTDFASAKSEAERISGGGSARVQRTTGSILDWF